MYFIIGEVDGYIEESNENKYLIFASTDKNKEVLRKYTERSDKIKSLIEKINNKTGEYRKGFIKIRFNSDNKLALNKILKLHNVTVIVKSVFEENSKHYP